MENLELFMTLSFLAGVIFVMLKFHTKQINSMTEQIKELNRRIDKIEDNHQKRHDKMEDKINKLFALISKTK